MLIIASHFTHNYGRANHKMPMLIKAKVLGRAKRGKVQPTKGHPPNQFKANPTPWKLGLHNWVPSHKHGNWGEIYYI